MSSKQHVFTPKEAFVARELERHGGYLTDLFEADIKRRNLISNPATEKDEKTKLINHIRSNPFTVDASNQKLKMDFPDYGRFIEIRYHRKKRAYKILGEEARRDVWKIRGLNGKRGKFAKWYAHNVYGALNTLIGRISWGYVEEIAAELKEALERDPHGVPWLGGQGIKI